MQIVPRNRPVLTLIATHAVNVTKHAIASDSKRRGKKIHINFEKKFFFFSKIDFSKRKLFNLLFLYMKIKLINFIRFLGAF